MYITDLHIKVLKGGRFQLLTPIMYNLKDKIITIHTGFTWDGASIPRSLWSTIGCPSDYLYESCLHDALYASNIYNRKDSDKMFYYALIARGVDYVTAKAMYLAVRVGGEFAYDREGMADAREFISVDFK